MKKAGVSESNIKDVLSYGGYKVTIGSKSAENILEAYKLGILISGK